MRKTNIYLTAIFFLITLTTVGQETKKVRVYKNNWPYYEVYFVLKKDKNVKHGNYQKKWDIRNCAINGYYKNNSKDSLWTGYFGKAKIVESQGNYLNDKKTGTCRLCRNRNEVLENRIFKMFPVGRYVKFSLKRSLFRIMTQSVG